MEQTHSSKTCSSYVQFLSHSWIIYTPDCGTSNYMKTVRRKKKKGIWLHLTNPLLQNKDLLFPIKHPIYFCFGSLTWAGQAVNRKICSHWFIFKIKTIDSAIEAECLPLEINHSSHYLKDKCCWKSLTITHCE